ncbi:MAG TPA: M3 family metallopeptidase [Rhodocyclaceae bacterium]|jgi:oligopeptidase A|nr:M3 family metallopeptidase [Rhodocyclaceae bacterium]HNL21536.1 M3 family metallopeptidase [Rhodocyclaceae bacterium]HNM21322.1 M3 family metallopeptidase [Rhodocyclaceae bacterium]HNM81104.1 M3 family metallopeptidase [Rhodocyclaceae bacterium]HNP03809.1 M3 family metallopeptidase [Rhodocyclaceae bacterium]
MIVANPLTEFALPASAETLPRFDAIEPDHVKPAIESLLADARSLVERLTDPAVPATWDAFAAPLADGLEHLSRAWGIVGHLHSINDIPAWREAYNAMLPEVTRFYTELGQNLRLFAQYKALRASPEYATLAPARRRIVDNEIRDFRLSGAELADDLKPRFQAIMEELASLAAKFQENLLDATNAFSETVADSTLLAGLPDDAIEAARVSAEKAGVEGWRFSLQAPSYGPVMQYADDRDFRARLYRAYATRAAEFHEGSSKPEWDNTPVMRRMLELRLEDARLLGYDTFAEVSLVPKMAESPAQVLAFLRELAVKAKPFAQRDFAELSDFARDTLGLSPLEPWDVAYASEKLLQARYAFSEQEVKQYFTEPAVLAGLFRVIENLFGVRVKPESAPVWHPDVRFYRLETPDGDLVGQFYLDLYARETKRGGAWMDEAQGRRRLGAGLQKPIAYLNCNFSAPVGGKPATFTHDEVITLFHETGHGLHHLLTRVEELGVSGIHGVEWDAVELPSQFMENYCWEWEVVEAMSAHVDSGAALPRELFDKMLAARNFQSGLQTVRQLEFALFDMLLHSEFDPAGDRSVMDLLATVRQEVAVILPPSWQRFPNSFSHIFGGGYAAGYFSYKWAEVLSADAYAAFEEAGNPFDPATGRRFLDEILSVGGSRPALESFTAFRGREPQVDALLRHSGMIAA